MTDCSSCEQEYDGWLVSVRIVQYLLLVVMEFECVCVSPVGGTVAVGLFVCASF